jgi:hypothetical protein
LNAIDRDKMSEPLPSRLEVANILERFLDGHGKPFAWDNFTLGMSFDDELLEGIRLRCAGLSEEFPPEDPDCYCSEDGLNLIREYVQQLRRSN